jgi:hypothetical protein
VTAFCRCHCRACGAHFTSLRAFDAHRVGPISDRGCELGDGPGGDRGRGLRGRGPNSPRGGRDALRGRERCRPSLRSPEAARRCAYAASRRLRRDGRRRTAPARRLRAGSRAAGQADFAGAGRAVCARESRPRRARVPRGSGPRSHPRRGETPVSEAGGVTVDSTPLDGWLHQAER